MNYRVKLYGHLSEDKERFPDQLADVLRIDVHDAKTLMDSVPVVILADASKGKAEHLAQELASIRALYLVEPEDRTGEAEAPSEPLISVADLQESRPTHDAEEPEADHWRRVLYAGIGTVALILAVMTILSVHKSSRSQYPPTATTPKVEEPRSQTSSESGEMSEYRAKLQARIDSLETQNTHIRSMMELKREDMHRQVESLSQDFELQRRTRRELGELAEELGSNNREIKALGKKLQQSIPHGPDRFE